MDNLLHSRTPSLLCRRGKRAVCTEGNTCPPGGRGREGVSPFFLVPFSFGCRCSRCRHQGGGCGASGYAAVPASDSGGGVEQCGESLVIEMVVNVVPGLFTRGSEGGRETTTNVEGCHLCLCRRNGRNVEFESNHVILLPC